MEAAKRQSFLKAGIPSTILNESAKFGKQIASAIIKWSEADGSNNAKQYISLSGEDVWTPASQAAAPFWAENRSLVKDVANVYALINPAYSSDTASSFYKMAREVYTVTSNLTPEQKAIALFWDDSPNGKYITVFGHWTFITANLIDQHRLPLMRAAETYAKMAIAMHDASILAWKGKYSYNVLRPETYIQQQIDPYWKPLIATPPHPEFPAAHATLSTAAAMALCSSFGERCAVIDNSYTDIGMQERSFASLQEAAMEAGLSRLYGGIHYRYSIEQGAMLGETTAKFIIQGLSFRKN